MVRGAKAAAVSCLESVWFGLLEPRTTESFNEGFFYFFFTPSSLFADVWLIGRTNRVILCLRLAGVSWTPTKKKKRTHKIPNKSVKEEENTAGIRAAFTVQLMT